MTHDLTHIALAAFHIAAMGLCMACLVKAVDVDSPGPMIFNLVALAFNAFMVLWHLVRWM